MQPRATIKGLFWSVGGRMRADRLAELVRGRRATVLMYHYFTAGATSSDPLVVPVSRFREQMVHLVRRFRPVFLSEAVAAAREGRRTARETICITVDDVGPDFLEHAWPVLRDLEIPVCLAVVPGFADPGARTERLLGIAHALVRNDAASAKRLAAALGLPALAYRDCFDRLRPLPPDRFAEVLEAAGLPTECVGALPGSVRLPVLDLPQLRDLVATGLAEIASHSMTHPDLRTVPESWLDWELRASRRWIVDHFGRCPGFVYPGGRIPTDAAIGRAALRGAGYDFAFGIRPGFLGAKTDFDVAPRIGVDGTEGFPVFRLRAAGIPAFLERIRPSVES